MVKVSAEQKPQRKALMQTYGASVIPSPSMTTSVGRKMNEQFPGSTGSLGTAISEAVEVAVGTEGYKYVLGVLWRPLWQTAWPEKRARILLRWSLHPALR